MRERKSDRERVVCVCVRAHMCVCVCVCVCVYVRERACAGSQILRSIKCVHDQTVIHIRFGGVGHRGTVMMVWVVWLWVWLLDSWTKRSAPLTHTYVRPPFPHIHTYILKYTSMHTHTHTHTHPQHLTNSCSLSFDISKRKDHKTSRVVEGWNCEKAGECALNDVFLL